jgi:tRNA dimethylallyltransferase
MNWTDDSVGADLPVICGPTGAGKSALALALAERVGGSILSADSRQVYRGFDIGTAKPAPDEQARIRHYGIDVADPAERYTAADWAASAHEWLATIRSSGRTPLIVGGTGFYLRALVDPLFEEPPIDAVRRSALRRLLGSMSAAEVQRWCETVDPARSRLGRAQWERAIEVALLAGRRISDLHGERSRAPVLTARYLVVDPGPSLARRLVDRTDAMLAAGWLDEVEVLTRSVPPAARAWTATGYEMLRRAVEGTLSAAAARDAVVVRTRQYAKRQRTWFRHQLPADRVTRIDPDQPDVMDRVMAWFHGREATR